MEGLFRQLCPACPSPCPAGWIVDLLAGLPAGCLTSWCADWFASGWPAGWQAGMCTMTQHRAPARAWPSVLVNGQLTLQLNSHNYHTRKHTHKHTHTHTHTETMHPFVWSQSLGSAKWMEAVHILPSSVQCSAQSLSLSLLLSHTSLFLSLQSPLPSIHIGYQSLLLNLDSVSLIL